MSDSPVRNIYQFAIALLLLISCVPAADLTITVTGIQPDRSGTILLFLYEKSTWMKLKSPSKAAVVFGNSATFTFESIPAGEYAVRIVHDVDKNGALTMKWTPPGPIEGYGFSSNYRPSGIPKYTPAAFSVPATKSMLIQMIYPK